MSNPEKSLENSKTSESWQDIFNALNDAVCLIDLQWNILQCNRAMSEFLGKPVHEISGKKCWEVMHGTSEPVENCPALIMKDTLRRESSILSRGDKWIEVTVDPLTDEEGDLAGIVHTISDVTQRVKIEEALKENEEYLKTIMDSIHAGIIMIDPDTHGVVDVNSYAADIIGFSKDQLREKKCSDFILSQEGKCPITDLKKNSDLSERILKRANGLTVPILKNVDVVSRKGRNYLMETFFDITDRKEAEEALKKSEEKYRVTFEHTGTAMAMIEEDTTISLVNEEFEELSGYSKEEIEGKMSWTSFVHEEDLKRMRKYHYSRRKGADVPKRYEFRFVDKQKKISHILLAIDMIPDKNKSVASLLDITNMKRVNSLLNSLSEINEVVAREKNPEVVLKTVCQKLHTLYDAVFTSLKSEKGLIPVRSEGIELDSLKKVIERCPSISKAMEGELMRMKMDDELCKHCTTEPHKYVISIPLIHNKHHGVITIHSSSEFSEDEITLLEKLSSNIAFALSAYEVERDREIAIEQLSENLMQFDRSADRLRNPLAVAIAAIDLKETYGYEEVFRIVNEQMKRIKKELDRLRHEEVKTYSLTQKAKSQGKK